MEINLVFKIAGVGIITWVINSVLKKADKDEIASFVTIAGLIIALMIILDMIGGLYDGIKSLLQLY